MGASAATVKGRGVIAKVNYIRWENASDSFPLFDLRIASVSIDVF